MNYLISISLRNLLRQKRRNILLGSAIAFGAMILVLANSFSRGISDVLFNEIVVYVAGHIKVSYNQDGNVYNQLFHDGERMRNLVKSQIPDITEMTESIGIMARGIGNGKADNVVMVGIDMDVEVSEKDQKEYERNFKMLEGSFEALEDTSNGRHPVGISEEKAKYLNLKLNDVLKVRFTDVHGQQQSARLTVSAIFKPANMFMSIPIFLELQDLKRLLGYKPDELAQLYIRIKDAKKNARFYADKLHDALKPQIAAIEGEMLVTDSSRFPLSVYGLNSDSSSQVLINSIIFADGNQADSVDKGSSIISSALANKTGLGIGKSAVISYKPKFRDTPVTFKVDITHVLKDSSNSFLLVNERDFYKTFYDNWPSRPDQMTFTPPADFALGKVLASEWVLLERARTTEDVGKKYREVAQKKTKAMVMDVQSMYESASAILQLEGVLNLITFSAVIILFFIILIGVVNTLRMTIKERTREIGTIRAIGMQRSEVRKVFILETGFLALFSSVAGTILAFATMSLLSLPKIDAGDNPLGMILSDGHLQFTPSAVSTVLFILLIIMISVITAFFPARKAAKLSAAEALRHFE